MSVDCSELASLVYTLARHHAKQPGIDSVGGIAKAFRDTHQLDFQEVELSQLLAEASAARAKDLSAISKQFPALMREAKGNVNALNALAKLQEEVEILRNTGEVSPTVTKPKKVKTKSDERLGIDKDIKDARDEIKNSPPKQAERLNRGIDKLEERLRRNEFAIPVQADSVPATKEVTQLEDRTRELRRKINLAVEDARPKTMGDTISEAGLAYKMFIAGRDMSAAGVQGGFVLATQPELTLRAVEEGLRGFRSEEGARSARREIEDRDNYVWYRTGKDKLALGDWDGPTSAQDEQYLGTLVRKFSEASFAAGGKAGQAALFLPQQIAALTNSAGRANTVLLNRLRADQFDMFAETAFGGQLDPAKASSINSLVNIFTGHARLPLGLESIAKALNNVVFSPRLMVSQFHQAVTVLPRVIVGEALNAAGVKTDILGGTELRKVVARIYARGILNASLMMTVAASAGMDVEIDPRSGNFGDVILPGNWHLNTLGPMRSAVVVLARSLPFVGGIRKADGTLDPVRGAKVALPDRLEQRHIQYLKSKRAPALGLAQDLLYKTDYRGKDTTFGAILGDALVPLDAGNVIESISNTSNVGTGVAAGIAKWFGLGLNHYDIQEEEESPRSRKRIKIVF